MFTGERGIVHANQAIRADLAAGGVGIIKPAKLHGVGVSVVQRLAWKPVKRNVCDDGKLQKGCRECS